MALDARDRSSIYTKLVPLLGERDANTLMSEFPLTDGDELITRQFLRAEMAELRQELHTEIGTLRHELHTEIGELRTEVSELRQDLGALRHDLKAEMADRIRSQTVWLVGVVFAGMGFSTTVAVALG